MTGHHRTTVTLSALVIANLLPVFGVLQLDWDVGAIVVLYWCENLVIGCYTLIKLFMAAGARYAGQFLPPRICSSLCITAAFAAFTGSLSCP